MEWMTYIRNSFELLSWEDTVDIGLVSIFVYFILLWVRTTKSHAVAYCMFVLLGFYILTEFLQLYLSTILFKSLFILVSFSLVVLFKDELRRIVERTLFKMTSDFGISDREADVLVDIAFSLASKNIGALIVITGNESISRYATGGVNLNGEINKGLLLSIFDPRTPGHDGAVIIKDGKIRKISTHLPLSKSPQLEKHMGTRHSAALGLSERCDAIVLVISEERGVVSIVEDGTIVECLTPTDVKMRLERFFAQKFPVATKSTWRLFRTEHLSLKLVSVCIVILIWLASSHQSTRIYRIFAINVDYINLPKGMVWGSEPLEQVKVTFQGTERTLDLMGPSKLKATIDLDNIKAGKHEILLSADNLRYPKGLKLFRIFPPSAPIELVKMNERRILSE